MYVVRTVVHVPVVSPPILADLPYSEEHGSVGGELISRVSHTHLAFRDDNSDIYHDLEEATRHTQYTASLSPFKRTKDGRGAYFALVTQYAGLEKW